MGRRRNSDNAALGIFYIFALPFIILNGIISLIFIVIGKSMLAFSKKKEVPVIDATKEMSDIIKHLVKNYKKLCYYKEILQIPESDRLTILKWVWDNWENHISDRTIKKEFPNYSIDILQPIYVIEKARIYMYYHQQEYFNNYAEEKAKPLVYVLYTDFLYHRNLCKIEDMPIVFNYLIQEREDDDISAPEFSIASTGLFAEECDYNYLCLWGVNEFVQVTREQLKQYCKKNKLAYPFK